MIQETKLTVNDLPSDVISEMKQAINKDKQMVALQMKKDHALHTRNYTEVTRLAKLIKNIEERVINSYLSSYQGQTERMDNLMTGMSVEDRELMNTYTNAIIFLCDMIETLSIESNQILKMYHPDYSIEMFRKLTILGEEAKEHVRFMSKNTDMIYQIAFANGADDIQELLLNKIKSFIKKLRRK